jgi:ABC-2 type transport system ATP-binding protein
VILQRGQVIREGNIAQLTRQRGLFAIGLAEGQEMPVEELGKIGYEAVRRGEYWEVGLLEGQSIDPVVDLLRARNLNLRHLVEKRQTLEELFMETVDSAEPGVDAPRHHVTAAPAQRSERIRK